MITQQTIIRAPLEVVYQSYAVIDNWLYALPDVLNTKIIYDDGIRQEFLMTVERDFVPETVRSIRYCKTNEQIELFQPEPPPKLEKMSGLWRFKDLGDCKTEVYAIRDFKMKENYLSEKTNYEKNLNFYLKQNLSFFKAFAEQKGRIQVSRLISADKNELIQCFWDIQRWYNIWSPIEKVEVDFDDGMTQIFSMNVWRDGICEEVKTIRKKTSEDVIEFTSPSPPLKLRNHSGSWIFEDTEQGTIVTATRNFEMDIDQLDGEVTTLEALKTYKYNLQLRLKTILEAFETYYKKKGE